VIVEVRLFKQLVIMDRHDLELVSPYGTANGIHLDGAEEYSLSTAACPFPML
jgi:hypothetical protein